MRSVKINRFELLNIVRENQIKHETEYVESVADYKAAVLKIAKENLALAESGDLDQISKMRNTPTEPVTYRDAYARAIRMLELSVDEVIELQDDVFNQLVLDEWSWKRGFVASSTMYKSVIGG